MAGIPFAKVVQMPQVGRVTRSPVHDYQIRYRPWQMQLNCIAPVLPGDTMKNALVNYTALTDPIDNPLCGWHLHHWLWYVPFRAIDDVATPHLQNMLLDPAFGELNAAYDAAASTAFYHANAADPSFGQLCVQAVIEEYFRNEGETWLSGHLDNVPQIGLKIAGLLESIILDSATTIGTEPDVLPGQSDEDDNLDEILGSGMSATFAASFNAYQALVAAGVLDVTYEDWLASYGVRMPKPNTTPVPEMLRYFPDWKKPGSVVNAADGTIKSAVKWDNSFRADKDRKFKEPGFIIGISCAVPKIYLSKQVQVGVDAMKNSLAWLPAVLAEQAFTSIVKYTGTAGPLAGNVGGVDYWVDLRDLFVGGDQFVNFALTETDANLIALPSATLARRFPSSADADGLFANASPLNKIREEGRTAFSFLSQVKDMTP